MGAQGLFCKIFKVLPVARLQPCRQVRCNSALQPPNLAARSLSLTLSLSLSPSLSLLRFTSNVPFLSTHYASLRFHFAATFWFLTFQGKAFFASCSILSIVTVECRHISAPLLFGTCAVLSTSLTDQEGLCITAGGRTWVGAGTCRWTCAGQEEKTDL